MDLLICKIYLYSQTPYITMSDYQNKSVTTHRQLSIEKLTIYLTSGILLLMSLLFYKERITFSDTAAYVSHIMARDKFEIGVINRYISIIPELLPYCAFKLGLPLKAILILYSISFTLIPIVLSLIAYHNFKEPFTAWSILIFYTLMSMNLFYYPVSEYQIGLCFILFFMGYITHAQKRESNNLQFILINLLFIPTIIFSHPLSFFVWINILILHTLFNKIIKRQLITIICVTILSAVVKRLFFNIDYEHNKFSQINNFKNFSTNDLAQELGSTFARLLIQDYFLVIILTILILIFLWQSKKTLLSFVFLASVIAWWVLITVCFQAEIYDHYYEHMYQAIPLIVSFVFCQYYLRQYKSKWTPLIVSIILIISLSKINSRSQFYTERINWLENCFAFMDKINCKKAIFTTEYILPSQGRVSFWSIPYETLLLSSLKGSQYSKTIYIAGNLNDLSKDMNLVYDIDELGDWPLVPTQYFTIEKRQYCIPENYISREVIQNQTFLIKSK